jgi:hypothetical protein
MIPYNALATAGASPGFNTERIPEYQSPFDTAPGTTAPLSLLSNFNIAVSGKNVFQQNQQYTYETFLQELAQANAINGGSSTGLSSGLIDQHKFENGHCYYIANLSRGKVTEENVYKSITVSGTLGINTQLEFQCFVVFQRRVTVDMKTGKLV